MIIAYTRRVICIIWQYVFRYIPTTKPSQPRKNLAFLKDSPVVVMDSSCFAQLELGWSQRSKGSTWRDFLVIKVWIGKNQLTWRVGRVGGFPRLIWNILNSIFFMKQLAVNFKWWVERFEHELCETFGCFNPIKSELSQRLKKYHYPISLY